MHVTMLRSARSVAQARALGTQSHAIMPLIIAMGLFCLICVSVSCAGQSGNTRLPTTELETPGETKPDPSQHPLPINVVRKGPFVLLGVEVLIDGHGPYEFLLDTNNGFTEGVLLLNKDLVEELGLPVSADGEEEHATVALTIAGYDLPRIMAASVDVENLFFGIPPPHGVLPLSLLSNYVVTIDLPNRELGIGQRHLPAGHNDVITTSTGRTHEPLVPVVIGQYQVQAALNLSVRSSVNLPIAYRDSLSLRSEPRRIGRLRNDEGEFEILAARFDGTLQIGGHEIEIDNVRFSGAFERIEIGYSILEEFAITIDQSRDRALLVRTDARIDIHTRAASVKNLEEDEPDLREAFNAVSDKVRMIVILAPT